MSRRLPADGMAILDIDPGLEENQVCNDAVYDKLFKPTKKAARFLLFHTLDFSRITAETQSYIGRLAFQVGQMNWKHLAKLDKQTKMREASTIVTGIALSSALTTKLINAVLAKCTDKKDFAAQDYLFAAMSGAIVFIAADFIAEATALEGLNNAESAVIFLSYAAYSLIMTYLTSKDSSDKIYLPNDLTDEICPTFPEASKGEKLLNALTGLFYGLKIAIPFWAYEREIRNMTVPLGIGQNSVVGIAGVTGAIIGSQMTDYPRVFHWFLALTKSAAGAGLSYAAQSGIASFSLMFYYGCLDGNACWDEDINSHLTQFFAVSSVAIGLFAGLSSRYRFQENHEGKEAIVHAVTHPRETAGKIRDKVYSCFSCLFASTAQDNSVDGDQQPINTQADEETTLLTRKS